MDKYEYKLRLEEIKTLNRKGRFQEAAQVADTIDWKKVRNITTLGIISDVYKINRRFEDAKEILLLANEKSPQNRRILYSLCDLTIKMGLIVEAIEYYKEFVQLAPNDNSKYILLYKIYEAQEISLEERIAVLKEYKKREYNEKWAYELAYLYHRVGLSTACVEECDQLILWFGEGRYVIKAMELKMLYVPLTPAQQQIYDRQFGRIGQGAGEPEKEQKPQERTKPRTLEEEEEELDIQVKTMDMGQYNTMNLQAALAASMREVWETSEGSEGDTTVWQGREDDLSAENGAEVPDVTLYQQPQAERRHDYGGDDMEYQEDVTKVIADSADWDAQATGQLEEDIEVPEEGTAEAQEEAPYDLSEEDDEELYTWQPQEPAESERVSERTAGGVQEAGRPAARPNRQQERLAHMLSQDYDGQISLALPDTPVAEKQITGQMNIEDVLAEWEKLKKENEEKRRQKTRQWMMEHTGPILDSFDQSSRDGVLERLQRGENVPPAKPAAGRGYEDASVYSEVEELEELEEIDESVMEEFEARYRRENGKKASDSGAQVRPAPANAAARAAMAAQGVLDGAAVGEAAGTKAAGAEQAAAGTGKPTGTAAEQAEAGASGKAAEEKAGAAKAAEKAGIAKPEESAEEKIEEKTENAGPVKSAAEQAEAAEPAEGAEEKAKATEPEESAEGRAEAAEPEGTAAKQAEAAEEKAGAAKPAETAAEQAEAAESAETVAEKAGAGETEGVAAAAEEAGEPETFAAQEAGDGEAGTEPESSEEPDGGADEEDNEDGEEQETDGSDRPREDTAALNVRISEQQVEDHVRSMTKEERELFAPYVPTRGAMRQLVKALDMISLSAYTGNMIITGSLSSDTMKLARSIIREVRASDQNFSGKIAKISGDVLNTKKPEALIARIPNGALIVEKASLISDEGAKNLQKALNQEHTGIIVFLLDTRRAIASLSERCGELMGSFTARFDIAALDSNLLVKYGCQYAYTQEFSIDELARLALHKRIEDMQTSDHAVTVDEVRDIVDEAIEHAQRFSPKHFVDVLLRKRYDEDDMIILREKDFI